MATLAEMVSKGRRKLEAKVPIMASNYEAAKPQMIANYRALPFGPNTTRAYETGVNAAVYTAPDVNKWARNWETAVSR